MTVALYKTWRGNEFVKESIESIYDHVEKIVFLHSEISWNGERGNDVIDVVHEWKVANDLENKIINISFDCQNQTEQYDFGIKFINQMLGRKDILLIDTDEVWDACELKELYRLVKGYPDYNAFGVAMHTYIKSPFYRVGPPEICNPTVYFNGSLSDFKGIRGIESRRKCFPDIHFHHFTYVRRNEEDLFKKIENIYKTESSECIDLKKWKTEKWDKLPDSVFLHTAKGYEYSWRSVREIGLNELPDVMRNNEIVKKFK